MPYFCDYVSQTGYIVIFLHTMTKITTQSISARFPVPPCMAFNQNISNFRPSPPVPDHGVVNGEYPTPPTPGRREGAGNLGLGAEGTLSPEQRISCSHCRLFQKLRRKNNFIARLYIWVCMFVTPSHAATT